jgi:predicted DNA-binding transcriptional regulator AlpA
MTPRYRRIHDLYPALKRVVRRTSQPTWEVITSSPVPTSSPQEEAITAPRTTAMASRTTGRGKPASTPDPRTLLSAEQVGMALGMDRSTIYAWSRKGLIPYVRRGLKRRLFVLDEVTAAARRRRLL